MKAAQEAAARPTGGSKAKVKKPAKPVKSSGGDGGAFSFLDMGAALPKKKKAVKKKA